MIVPSGLVVEVDGRPEILAIYHERGDFYHGFLSNRDDGNWVLDRTLELLTVGEIKEMFDTVYSPEQLAEFVIEKCYDWFKNWAAKED